MDKIIIGIDLGIVNNAIGVLTTFKVEDNDDAPLEYFYRNEDRKVVSFINWIQTQKIFLHQKYPKASISFAVEDHDWVKASKKQEYYNQTFAFKNAVFLNKLVGVLEAITSSDDYMGKIYYFKPFVVKRHLFLTTRSAYLPKTNHEQDAMELAFLGMDKFKAELVGAD